MDKNQEKAFQALKDDARRFWDDIGCLEDIVCEVVQSPQAGLHDGVLGIRNELSARNLEPEARTERILNYVSHLLSVPTRYPPDALQSCDEKHAIKLLERWMDETTAIVEEEHRQAKAAAAGPSPSPAELIPGGRDADIPRDFNERRDEILMESLTAAWLALYFLGLPFSQIWERVRRMADERGGYPSGACVTKFIGDVHRIGRLEMARELKAKNVNLAEAVRLGKYDASQTLVLSYMPFGLLKELVHYNAGHLTPGAAHCLGNCYMLLQMRLYIREGFPIRYLVSRESLKQNWENLLANPKNDAQAMFDGILGWMGTVFANDLYHQSVQLITGNGSIAGMSTCVLGRQVGVYVLDTSRTSLPFAGNQLTGSLLLSYRAKLNRIARGTAEGVLQLRGGPPLAADEAPHKRAEHLNAELRKILQLEEPSLPEARRA